MSDAKKAASPKLAAKKADKTVKAKAQGELNAEQLDSVAGGFQLPVGGKSLYRH